MGQFINSDCNTWKVSRPSPHCYFTAPHKSRRGSTTAVATTAIKINTAAANTLIGGGESLQGKVRQIAAIAVRYLLCTDSVTGRSCSCILDLVCFLSGASSGALVQRRGGGAAGSPLREYGCGSEERF